MPTVDELIQTIKNGADQDRYADAMMKLAACGHEAVPALMELLNNPVHRWAALRVLAEIGPEAKAAVSAIIEMAKGLDPGDRMHAALALGSMGPVAVDAVPALLELLRDPVEASFVREAAETALNKIAPQVLAQAE